MSDEEVPPSDKPSNRTWLWVGVVVLVLHAVVTVAAAALQDWLLVGASVIVAVAWISWWVHNLRRLAK
ncbi:hypothetical protein [Mycetocola zhadangensis]|nr:hypothetical protein [Mycetocola zhadangensis]